MKHHWGWTVVVLVIGFLIGGYLGGVAGLRSRLGV